MTVSVAALVVALVALVATLVVAEHAARGRREADERLAVGMREIGGKMDGLVSQLAVAVEKVRKDAIRARTVESLRQPLDAEELLARCAEAAAALPGAAGATAVATVQGTRLEASAGLPVDGDRGDPHGPPGGGPVRAVAVSYHYRDGDARRDRLHSAIAVPLLGRSGEHLGFLTVFGADEDPPVSGGDFGVLEEIARQAGPAIESAALRRESPQAVADPLTGLPARRDLHDRLALEVARAQRIGDRLTLCLFEIDRLAAVDAGLEPDDIDVAAATALREAARPGDVVFRHGTAAFAVILADAGRIDGEALAARLAATIGEHRARQGRLHVNAGIAELKDDDDGLSLFARAERSLRRERSAGTAA